jgi:hypothetical protein
MDSNTSASWSVDTRRLTISWDCNTTTAAATTISAYEAYTWANNDTTAAHWDVTEDRLRRMEAEHASRDPYPGYITSIPVRHNERPDYDILCYEWCPPLEIPTYVVYRDPDAHATPHSKKVFFDIRRDPLTQTEIWRAWIENAYGDREMTVTRSHRKEQLHRQGHEDVWNMWMRELHNNYGVPPRIAPSYDQFSPQTQEQVQELRRRREACALLVRIEREQEERRVAAERAEQLLISHLTRAQRKSWERDKAIEVKGRSGRTYRIKCGRAGNVYELDDKGRPVASLCVHLVDPVPDQDNVLWQLLAIQHDEEEFLRRANRSAILG